MAFLDDLTALRTIALNVMTDVGEHRANHNDANRALEALRAKLGTFTDAPAVGTALRATADGESRWQPVTLIDVRDFGNDRTLAWQEAIAWASRIEGNDRVRLGSTATDFTLTVPGYGTTATIAQAATNAAIQAALEAVVGSGKVTVATVSGERIVTFDTSLGLHGNVSDIYSSTYIGSGTGPLVYPLEESQAVGGDVWCPGLSDVEDTLRVTQSNVRLLTGHQWAGTLAGGGGGVEALRSGYQSNGIRWVGEDGGGPVVEFFPSGLLGLTGVGFAGTIFSGHRPYTTAADVGLRLVGVTRSNFEYIHTVEFKDAGLLLDIAEGEGPSVVDDPDWPRSVAYNNFRQIGGRQWVNTGDSVRIQGARTGQANHYLNRFDQMNIAYLGGNGLVMENCDSNWFGTMECNAPVGYSGYGVKLVATELGAGSAGYCRGNFFDIVMPGRGGVYSEGTENGRLQPAFWNFMDHYYDNGFAPLAPTIGTGSNLVWNNRRKNPPIMQGTAF